MYLMLENYMNSQYYGHHRRIKSYVVILVGNRLLHSEKIRNKSFNQAITKGLSISFGTLIPGGRYHNDISNLDIT